MTFKSVIVVCVEPIILYREELCCSNVPQVSGLMMALQCRLLWHRIKVSLTLKSGACLLGWTSGWLNMVGGWVGVWAGGWGRTRLQEQSNSCWGKVYVETTKYRDVVWVGWSDCVVCGVFLKYNSFRFTSFFSVYDINQIITKYYLFFVTFYTRLSCLFYWLLWV